MIKNLLNKFNDLGIPFPLVRNNKTGKGSFTASLVVMSAFFVMVSLISDKVDFWHAFTWNIAAMVLYDSRKAKISKDEISFDNTNSEDKPVVEEGK